MIEAYVRIKRNGEWQNLEIDKLTDAELEKYFQDSPKHKVVAWATFLAGWIRDNVKDEEQQA